MTEDEAKTKWCPFARTVVTSDRSRHTATGNRAAVELAGKVSLYAAPNYASCIASDCAVWHVDHCGLAGARP